MSAVLDEGKRATRYTIVVWVSRGVDLSSFAFLLWLWGKESLMPAFVLSSMANWVLDFCGQKFWAFKDPDRTLKDLAKEAGLYVMVRGINIAAAAGAYYLLYNVLGFSIVNTLIIVMPIFWATKFAMFRLFVFTPKDTSSPVK